MLAKEKHHGAAVWVNKITDKLRKTECLCLNCSNIRECEVSSKFYALCVTNDIALMVTRCKKYKLSEVVSDNE